MNSRLMIATLVVAVALSGSLMANTLRQDTGADGIVSVEAENYDELIEQSGGTFELTGPKDDFTGVFGMEGTGGGNAGTTGYAASNPHMNYLIEFVKTGTHYVWVRAWGASGSDDSCHVGLNGEENTTSNRMDGWNANYTWSNDTMDNVPAFFEVPTVGVHTLNVYQRENGLIIDKIVLTTNPDYVPTGDGPPESDRGPSLAAVKPVPGDGAEDVLRDSLLSWTPSEYAVTHNVFVGQNFDDVNDATEPTFSNLDANSLDPGRYDFGQTYFWRVDEVNGAPDRTVFKGDIWSFTAEPYSIQMAGSDIIVTASSVSDEYSIPENTTNGTGLGDDETHGIKTETMWFTAMDDLTPWIQYEFDGVKKLDIMKVWNSNNSAESFLGYGVKGVLIEYSTDGQTWETLEDANEFSRAPGRPTYNEYDLIDFGGAVAKMVRLNIQSNWGGFLTSYSLSEVQFSAIPAAARTPLPVSGSVDILPGDVLSWRAGREAAQSRVYVSTDANEIADGLAPSLTSTTNSINLSAFDIEMGQTYYWRVDEVNNAEAASVWPGPVWSFLTVATLVVDDFERYNNDSPDRPFQVWLDGYGYSADEFFPAGYNGNGTGAGIGHDIWSVSSDHYNGDIMETTNTKPGSGQAMPFYYNNTGGVASQTERAFAPAQDWTLGGAQTLSIAFSGQTGNTGTLYVKINNSKIVYTGDPGNMALGFWQTWNVDLSSVNVQNVTKLQIGVEGSGAAGMLLIDDITLNANAVDPGDTGNKALVVWVSFHGADNVPADGAAGAGFTEAPDKAYTDLLKASGYNVIRYVTTNAPSVETLNTADLVIVSRSVASGGYQDDGATRWNSVTAPMIITGGYTIRSSRMGFTTGTTMVDTTGDITLTVNNPSHPVFAGIELAAGTMANSFAGVVTYPTDGTTVSRGISVNDDPLNADGTLLATISDAGNGPAGGMVIAEWQTGATMTHTGGVGTDTLAGHRLVFLTGSREASGISSETAGLYDLYEEGEQMLVNAVEYMLQ